MIKVPQALHWKGFWPENEIYLKSDTFVIIMVLHDILTTCPLS